MLWMSFNKGEINLWTTYLNAKPSHQMNYFSCIQRPPHMIQFGRSCLEPYLVEGNINLVDLSSGLTIGVHKMDDITYLLSVILHVLHIKTWSRMHAYMERMYLFMVYSYTNVGAMGSQSNGGLGGQNFQKCVNCI
jgi:hypothetical protein